MALAFGADLGFGFAGSGSGTTVTFNTTAVVPSGGTIVAVVSMFNDATVTASGGGLTWATDYTFNSPGSDRNAAMCSANAPSGLASSTTITITYSTACFSRGVAGAYFTGVATSSYTDGGQGGEYDGNASWETATLNTTNADDLLVGMCWADFAAGATSTATAPFAEISDHYDATNDNSLTMTYRIVSATGGYIGSGTWSADVQWTALMGSYKAGGPPPVYAIAWTRA
jgi:hypothetical protein